MVCPFLKFFKLKEGDFMTILKKFLLPIVFYCAFTLPCVGMDGRCNKNQDGTRILIVVSSEDHLQDSTVLLLDAEGELIGCLGKIDVYSEPRFNPTGCLVDFTCNGIARLFDAISGKEIHPIL